MISTARASCIVALHSSNEFATSKATDRRRISMCKTVGAILIRCIAFRCFRQEPGRRGDAPKRYTRKICPGQLALSGCTIQARMQSTRRYFRNATLAAMLICAAAAWALDPHQDWRHYGYQSWGTDSGLPQNTVHAIQQTRD